MLHTQVTVGDSIRLCDIVRKRESEWSRRIVFCYAYIKYHIWWNYPFISWQDNGEGFPPSLFDPPADTLEIVIIIAPAACGKSTLSRRFDRNLYTRINQDTLHTIEKCLSHATDQLSKGMTYVRTFLPSLLLV